MKLSIFISFSLRATVYTPRKTRWTGQRRHRLVVLMSLSTLRLSIALRPFRRNLTGATSWGCIRRASRRGWRKDGLSPRGGQLGGLSACAPSILGGREPGHCDSCAPFSSFLISLLSTFLLSS